MEKINLYQFWYAFGHKPSIQATGNKREHQLLNKLFNSFKSFYKILFKSFQSKPKSLQITHKPILSRVEVIEFITLEDIAFSRNYPVVQVRDAATQEIMNVYEANLIYGNGKNVNGYFNSGVYLLKESEL